jgi:hypothetical protein
VSPTLSTRSTRSLLALALSLTLAGCVTVRSSPPDFDQPWPPLVPGSRPAIELVVSGVSVEYEVPRDLGPILDDWGSVTERAYRESGLFSDVAIGERRDLRVNVDLRAEINQNRFLAALSYTTLLIIPHVVTTDITLTTRVTDDSGRPLGTMEVQGRSRTWHQFLLFPASSFFEPRTVTPAIVYDLNRETIDALHARGIF